MGDADYVAGVTHSGSANVHLVGSECDALLAVTLVPFEVVGADLVDVAEVCGAASLELTVVILLVPGLGLVGMAPCADCSAAEARSGVLVVFVEGFTFPARSALACSVWEVECPSDRGTLLAAERVAVVPPTAVVGVAVAAGEFGFLAPIYGARTGRHGTILPRGSDID